MARSATAGSFTLVVPTYNRPVDLSRLLKFLAHGDMKYPVLVLDSSAPDIQEANRAMIAALGADIRLEQFASTTPPWEKFWRGCELVETDFCSLCADDDVVIPDALCRLVQFLADEPSYGVAHGWYFSFYLTTRLGITDSVYKGRSLDQGDALVRLSALFRSYEALTYGVYRTSLMKRALSDVRGVESMMAKELLGGALAAVHGRVARLPVFYYGRGLDPSQSHTQTYTHWHPLHILASSPAVLFADYARYREILVASLKTAGYDAYGQEELFAIVDLIHLRYLGEYTKPAVLDRMIEQAMARTPRKEAMQEIWSVLAQHSGHSIESALSSSVLLRKIRDRYFPRLKLHHLRRVTSSGKSETVRSITASGAQRECALYAQFLASVRDQPSLREAVPDLVRALDRFE